MTAERRDEFFQAVTDQVEEGNPGRFRSNLRANYIYLHDLQRTRLDLYVSLQRPRSGTDLLTVACETASERPDTYEALMPHIPAIEAQTGFPERLSLLPPGSAGRRGPIKKGVIAWHIDRPDLTTAEGVAEASQWAAQRVLALHRAIEPYWTTTGGGAKRGRSGEPDTDDSSTTRVGSAKPFARSTTPEPAERVTDGEATADGLAGHEDTVAKLDRLVRAAGYTPLYDGAPRVDISWQTAEGLVIVEVKSVTAANETHQIRLALGQILDYAVELTQAGHTVLPAIAISGDIGPSRWGETCAAVGVQFTEPSAFSDLLSEAPPPWELRTPRAQASLP